jgi:5,10-methylenetetrahydromethanopterin reductase
MEIAAVAELYPARLTIGLAHGMAGWMRQIGAYPRSPLIALAGHIQAVRALTARQATAGQLASGHWCRKWSTPPLPPQ